MENGSLALEILNKPEEIRRCIAALRYQRETMFALATSTTSSCGPRVGSASGFSRHDTGLVALADIETEIARYEKELAGAEQEVKKLLSMVEAVPGWKAMRSVLLLRLMFVQRLPWDKVSASLRDSGWRVPVSGAARKNWLNDALKIADSALPVNNRTNVERREGPGNGY